MTNDDMFIPETDKSGVQRWFDNDGVLVREGGPAVIRPNGINEWWRYPTEYSLESVGSECYRVDIPTSMSKQIAKMAEHMKNETEVRRFKVSHLDLHIEVSIEFFTKKEDGSAVCRRKSIYIVRRDPCDVTEELGGDSFKISYLVYEDGVLLTEECSELDDGEGPIITYEDIMSCVDGFAAATDYEINHLKLPMPFVCRPQPK